MHMEDHKSCFLLRLCEWMEMHRRDSFGSILIILKKGEEKFDVSYFMWCHSGFCQTIGWFMMWVWNILLGCIKNLCIFLRIYWDIYGSMRCSVLGLKWIVCEMGTNLQFQFWILKFLDANLENSTKLISDSTKLMQNLTILMLNST